MPNYKPLIGGIAYSWESISVLINSPVPVIGIASINYAQTRRTSDVYYAGSNPSKRSYGNVASTGSIELTLNEINNLIKIAPQGKLWNIPSFNIIVMYLPVNGVLVTHKLIGCQFMDLDLSQAQDQADTTAVLNLAIADIEYK